MKRAVRAGYWNLLRYNPELEARGENLAFVDSRRLQNPTETSSWERFVTTPLQLKFPERAEQLFDKARKDAMERYESSAPSEEKL